MLRNGWMVASLFFVSCVAATAGGQPNVPAPAPLNAAAPASQPTVAELGTLIKALDADQWAARTRAAERIVLLGEAARPELEELMKGQPSAEAVQQVRVILGKLDKARQFGPTLVTLHVKDKPAREALAALATAAGVSFEPTYGALWPIGEDPHVAIDVERAGLFECLQRVGQQAGVRVVKSGPNEPIRLTLEDAKAPSGPWATVGPYLIRITRIEHTRIKEFGGAGRRSNVSPGCRISFFVWGEPKIQAGSWSFETLDEVVTDKGAQAVGRGGFYGPGGMTGSDNESTIYINSDVPGERIVRLRFSMRFVVVGKTETFEVKNVLAAGRTQRDFNGYGMSLENVNKVVDGQYAYSVDVRRGEHTTAEFNAFRQALSRSMPKLLDAQGRALQFRGGSGESGMDHFKQTNQLTCDTPKGRIGEPATFSWELPLETTVGTYPVEFKDLPLP